MKRRNHFLSISFPHIAVAILLIFTSSSAVKAQNTDTLNIVCYNALNFCGSTCSERIPAFRTIFSALEADIVVTQEQTSSSEVNQFLNDILNYVEPGEWSLVPWTNGYDTDNACFYRNSTVTYVSTQQISTPRRDISEYVLKPKGTDATGEFRVYSLHLKANDTPEDEAKRLEEATVLRNYLNALPDGSDFLVMGDFNCYSSDDLGYQKLIGSEADNSGRCFDPIDTPGSWNNNCSFASIHTQSTRATAPSPPDGGATGGLDDRFDLIIASEAFLAAGEFECLTSTYRAYGNDGYHCPNANINDSPIIPEGITIANALYRASDHLPVLLDFLHPAPSITVLDPDGGETWYIGTTDTIYWDSDALDGNVTITINRDYPTGGWETLYSGTANDGEQPWLVTNPTSENCRIRIVGDAYGGARDSSDADFTITDPYITITSPNGGENWFWGETHDILWNSGAGGNVDISLNRDYPTGEWESLFTGTPNDGVESWEVSDPTTSNARIRIISSYNPSIRDSSNGDFSISDPTLTLIIPNGNEIWTAGSNEAIGWTGEGLLSTDSVRVYLNRQWPGPDWEYLDTEPYWWYLNWPVTGPGTTSARIRIISYNQLSVRDECEANFIIIGQNEPPLLLHDPVADGNTDSMLFVASAFDEYSGVSVKLFYKPDTSSVYDSTAMNPTGNPYEFSAVLKPLAAGSYDYFIRATDINSETTATDIYDFQISNVCETTISYDNGAADRFNWAGGEAFRWAVRFTPTQIPFVLCGASFSVSRLKPDSVHTRVIIEVYDDDGYGMPGDLLLSDTTGAVENVVGGLPSGSPLWANAILLDDMGEPLTFNDDFFIALRNPDTLKYEAFARDTTGPNSGRSYLYDECEELWYNENDACLNCKVGNRLIRAIGYVQNPPEVVIVRAGDDAQLHWTSTGAPYYRIYSSNNPFDTFSTLEGSSSDTTFLDTNAVIDEAIKFYRVVSSTEP
ncbi:hypothetical protein KKB28_03060 [bacterium]|nr:hypothetical protein [bacterium]